MTKLGDLTVTVTVFFPALVTSNRYNFLCLCIDNDVTVKICYVSVMVTKYQFLYEVMLLTNINYLKSVHSITVILFSISIYLFASVVDLDL
jgi:hypothetical protein